MQEVNLENIVNCPLIGLNSNGILIHVMAVNTPEGIKLFERNPPLYPGEIKITKKIQL